MKSKRTKAEAASTSGHKAEPTAGEALPIEAPSKHEPEPTHYTAAGEKAFATLEPKLLGLSDDRLDLVNIDVQIAATTALSVAQVIAADKILRARFEALAAAREFELHRLDGLATSALAAWFARHMYLLASATHSDAQLPSALVKLATELKARMMRVVEYHLGDHKDAGPIIAAIRPGTGHMDLANDLAALARLYRQYTHLLAEDKKRYQAADQALAEETAEKILTLRGGNASEQRKWADRQARAWTWLNADYAEVCAAGRYLKRYDSDVESAFPSLVAASRGAPSRSGSAGSGEGGPLPGGGND